MEGLSIGCKASYSSTFFFRLPCPHLHRSIVAIKRFPLLVLAPLGYPCLKVYDQLACKPACSESTPPGTHMQQRQSLSCACACLYNSCLCREESRLQGSHVEGLRCNSSICKAVVLRGSMLWLIRVGCRYIIRLTFDGEEARATAPSPLHQLPGPNSRARRQTGIPLLLLRPALLALQ